jgi:predicted RNase H-like nuclease
MVLAYYAKQSVEKGIKTIPNEVEFDSQGLPKAIHFV